MRAPRRICFTILHNNPNITIMNLLKLADQVTETIPVIRRRQSQAIDTVRIPVSSNTTDETSVSGFTQLVL
jgi:hypothetical protein